MIANEIFINMNQASRERVVEMLEQCRVQSKFPEGWKETELKWIYKKADPSKIVNYRPIALTDTLYKLFTRIMVERLEKVIETFGVVTDLQNGFRTDRSCMAAVMTLNIIMARRLAQSAKKPFYVAYIDISKAYDTVNHDTLWNILHESGITGTWLENLKELYRNNFLRSYTPIGKTGAIKMERGIRQGCPLSPLLFALYANPIAIAMERVNEQKGKEPAMLMYADDMVVWGDTEKEVQEKLQVAVDMMEKLGLQISLEKTEVQYNKWAEEQNKGQGIEIQTEDGIEIVPYKDTKQALRYLGTWSTANMETNKGMELLKEKMANRLEKIKGAGGTPSSRVRLIRSRIVSTWNYTAAVQTIEKEIIQTWEKEFYAAIAMGDMQGFREDLVYETTGRTGLGMTKLSEEYEKNRLRTLTQIMEAGERMKGRGQTPWAQKLLMEEMNKEEPCMEAIKEMKVLLKELGLTWTRTEEKYKAWKNQFQMEQQMEHKVGYTQPLSRAQVKIAKHKIPLSMIDYFQRTAVQGDTKEPWEKALEYTQKQEKIVEEELPELKDTNWYTGIRLKNNMVRRIESITKSTMLEWGVSIENRSTDHVLTKSQIKHGQVKENQVLLINLTQPKKLREKSQEINSGQDIQELMTTAAKKRMIIVLIDTESSPTPIEGIKKISMATEDYMCFENTYGTHLMPRTMDNKENITVSIIGGMRAGMEIRIQEEIMRTGERTINNMYERKEEQGEKEWECPLCQVKGERLNEFGVCRNQQCMGVRTERSFRSRAEEEKRKAETLLIGGHHKKGDKKCTRVFWSDGSGMDLMHNGVLTTGWGLVECKQEVQTNGTIIIKKCKTWKGRSKMLESVQVCEARAVLKAVQVAEAGEPVHIHTDSKGTVQKLRAMMGKTYREKRAITNKGILQEIIDTAHLKQIPVMIEWVKGHENMSEKVHNWISRMKQEGNEMADKVAKEATHMEDLEQDFNMDQEWTMLAQSTKQHVNWSALPKIYTEKKKQERTQRLKKPSDPRVSKYGQGVRCKQARADRTILHEMAMKADGDIHFMAVKYATNKYMTREFQSRQLLQAKAAGLKAGHTMPTVEEFQCPMCSLCEQRKVIQTKEHVWGGSCVISKETWNNMEARLTKEMNKWACTKEQQRQIAQVIMNDWSLATEEYIDGDISKHANSMGIVGIWKNKTVQKIVSILTKAKGWTEELAMERTKDLAYINMKGATEIANTYKNMRKAMETKLTEGEREMQEYSRGRPSLWIQHQITVEELKKQTVIRQRIEWTKGRIDTQVTDMMINKLETAKKRSREEDVEELKKIEQDRTTKGRLHRLRENNAKRRRIRQEEQKRETPIDRVLLEEEREEDMQVEDARAIDREQAAEYSSNSGKDGPQKSRPYPGRVVQPHPYPGRVVPGMKQSLGGEVNRPNPHYYTTLHYTTRVLSV